MASGWHTACLAMRIVVDGLLEGSTSMGFPGLDKLEWLRPVRPDDPLTLTLEVLEARPSRSKPDRGSVKFGYVLVNGAGETVFTMVAWVMFGRRTPVSRRLSGSGRASRSMTATARRSTLTGALPSALLLILT